MSRLPIMSITNDFVFTWANSGCKRSRRTTDPVSGRQYSFFFSCLGWDKDVDGYVSVETRWSLAPRHVNRVRQLFFYAEILIRSRLVYAQHPDANVHQNVTDMYRHYKLSTCFLFQFILWMWKQYVHAGKQLAFDFQFIIILPLIQATVCLKSH